MLIERGKIWSKFIPCDCWHHGILLMHDWEMKDPIEHLDLCIYTAGFDEDHKPSLWQRLRSCWQILRRGHPYGDQIILNKDTAIKLRSELDALIPRWGKGI